MNYRVEVAPSNRAACTDTVCKSNGEKIMKGDLRFGTHVEFGDHPSFKWKHWGCVSGFQMQTIREHCKSNSKDGELAFDFFDGYDELEDKPEIQEKIRRCVTNGHIDMEDFRGDPSYNEPGKRGIRAPKRKERKENASNVTEETASEVVAAGSGTDGPAPKKRRRKNKKTEESTEYKGDNERDEVIPAKRKRGPPKARS